MKDCFINIGRKLFIPTSALMIIYCVFYQYVVYIPYHFVIKLILAILLIFNALGWIFGFFINSVAVPNGDKVVKSNLVRNFYRNSYRIIIQLFCYYFSIYLIFMLNRESVIYNYLILLLFGVLIGYRIACKANLYLGDK